MLQQFREIEALPKARASRLRRETGIRLALGASSHDIVQLIVGGGFQPIVAGAALGLAGALAASRVLAGLLFHVSPADPLTFAATIATILVAGFAAMWIPARRACRVDPVSALRAE
jgi:ABC-type antimicrobial peptide transport system permease subunit